MPAEEQIKKRVMPYSLDAEQAVIGAMISDKDAIVTAMELLTSDDFYGKQNGIIFDAIIELYDRGSVPDVIPLQNKLKEKGIPDEINNIEYLGGLVADTNSSLIRDFCNILIEKSTLRKMIKINEGIANACYEGKQDYNSLLEETEKKVFDLVQSRKISSHMPIDEVVMQALSRIEAASQSSGNVTGVPTGFLDLDYKLAGLHGSNLVLIAARPAMGKTAFVLNIAEYVALRKNMAVAIFSLEMGEVELVNRLLSLESNVDSGHIRTGNLSDDEWEKIVRSAGDIGDSNLIIDAPPSLTVSELRSKCRKYKMEKDIKLIIIDYLQLMKGSSRAASESRQQEISEISRSLKSLARELDIPVIALSQLSRAVEQRPDKRPMLSDLRESGAIEQDADVVMFIYRDDYYNKDSKEMGIAEINVAKQRSGPTGVVKLAWLPDYTKFANLEKRYQSNEG
ncbi:MAG: replicative DNA helicase [Lachnospiraceae bacterium]|nr:replicative DNA helicase [Lachnospiraceae bacterium]MDD5853424.1 replicative DNA helicase [Lachnospiraceae bacterium]